MTIIRTATIALLAASGFATSLEAQRPVRKGPLVRPRGTTVTAPASAPTPPSTPAPAQQGSGATERTRGTYRVTLTGFTVNRETYDDPLQLDGKRDEVYIAADVLLLYRDGAAVVPGTGAVRSAVLGDVGGMFGGRDHNGRIRAGSASPQGGLRTGDHHPSSQPWRLTGAPTADRLPLELWRGELVKGENAVLVTPTIWEFDNPDLRSAYTSYLGWGQRTAAQLAKSKGFMAFMSQVLEGTDEASMVVQLTDLGFSTTLSLAEELGRLGDRPIGMEAVPDAPNQYKFAPRSFVLSLDMAERLLAQSVGGKGPGSVAIAYEESDAKLGGKYVLYLLVQRLD